MANMGYCRYENTYKDLMDCYEALGAEDVDKEILRESEKKYKEKLIRLCGKIRNTYFEMEEF